MTFSKDRTPTLEAINLNDVAKDVCDLMMARAEECQVNFEYEQADNIPISQFDPEGIHRAILNVVTNAIDAVEASEDGRVRVFSGKVELGQGIRNAIRQVAAEELCMDLDRVGVVLAETEITPNEGYTAGSGSIQNSAMADKPSFRIQLDPQQDIYVKNNVA